MLVSLFNDVIGPVMRGSSSSHCAAALRIGRLARDLMQGQIVELLVEFDRHGSLPTTHESQGSDMGLAGGLLGWEADDPRLPDAWGRLGEAGVRTRIEIIDAHDSHPNTYRLTLSNAEETHRLVAISTGGGMMKVIELDGIQVSIQGDYHEVLLGTAKGRADALIAHVEAWDTVDEVLLHRGPMNDLLQVRMTQPPTNAASSDLALKAEVTWLRTLTPVLPVGSKRGRQVPFTCAAEMLTHDAKRGTPLWQLATQYEMARGGFTEVEVRERMAAIVRTLRHSLAEGIAGTHYADRVLGPQSRGFKRQMDAGRLLEAGALNRIVLYVSALMEVKSAMGVIVAAPTAGACAALPGAVIAMAEGMNLPEEDMVKAMLAAGLIGVFIATRWTFAAEVGGCQAEGGAASSMAAAALVTLANGSLAQSLAAASIALQNMLGLICDPVAGRVEVPCLGKNVMAASNALACANLALADYDPVIPLDEVIDAAKSVSSLMPRELRCTALGGLSATPSSRRIELTLNRKRASGHQAGQRPT